MLQFYSKYVSQNKALFSPTHLCTKIHLFFYFYFNKYFTNRIHLSLFFYPKICAASHQTQWSSKQTIQPNEARLKHSNCVLCKKIIPAHELKPTTTKNKATTTKSKIPLVTNIFIQHCFVRFLSSHKYFVDFQWDISFYQALWWLFAFKIQDVSTCLKVRFRSNTSNACSHWSSQSTDRPTDAPEPKIVDPDNWNI